MTELLTSAEMRAIEQYAIGSGVVTGAELMERAGHGVVEAIFEEWPEYGGAAPDPCGVSPEVFDQRRKAVVLCGPGNNGGDGYVIARLLKARGWDVALLASEITERTPSDALCNRKRWEELGPVLPLSRDGLEHAGDADLYIDAVFGTGLTRPAIGEIGEVLRYLAGNGGDFGFFQPRIVAVDVPSGLCADSGRVLGSAEPSPGASNAPFARMTVSFETPKPGHFLADGPDLCGKLVIKDIGLERQRSRQLVDAGGELEQAPLRPIRLSVVPQLESGPREPHQLFPPRVRSKAQGHKYDHGHVLVLTGGMGRTGAARLAARGALRMGAGLVTLAAPGSAMMEIAGQITALMLRRADDGAAISQLLEDARLDVICLGPGLGRDANAQERLEAVIAAASLPDQRRQLVLDADALSLLCRRAEPFAGLGSHVVLTPHSGEFARLFPDIAEAWQGGRAPSSVVGTVADRFEEADRYRDALLRQPGPAYSKVDAVRAAAKRSGAVVLLKGRDTVVADPSGQAFVHAAVRERSAPWLATAGSGDVLAGFVAGLLARCTLPAHAAILAAQCHVDCALGFGPGLIAEDLPEQLPAVLRALECRTGREWGRFA